MSKTLPPIFVAQQLTSTRSVHPQPQMAGDAPFNPPLTGLDAQVTQVMLMQQRKLILRDGVLQGDDVVGAVAPPTGGDVARCHFAVTGERDVDATAQAHHQPTAPRHSDVALVKGHHKPPCSAVGTHLVTQLATSLVKPVVVERHPPLP